MICIGVALIILGLMLTLVLTINLSWWWFWGTLILFAMAGAATGIIMYVLSLQDQEPVKPKLEQNEAILILKSKKRNEADEPEELQIINTKRITVGQEGLGKTDVLEVEARGTWFGENFYCLIDMTDPSRYSILKDANDIQKIEAQKKFAVHPELEEKEEHTLYDKETGEPIRKVIRIKQTQAQKEKEEEKKEAEKKEEI